MFCTYMYTERNMSMVKKWNQCMEIAEELFECTVLAMTPVTWTKVNIETTKTNINYADAVD